MKLIPSDRPYLVALLCTGPAAFIIVAVLTYFTLSDRIAPAPHERQTLADAIRAGTAAIPPLSSSTADKLARSRGFQALMSYTDLGFEPREVTIHRGDAVRFTNNSSQDVWIAATGERIQIYPRTSESCGSSALDSCIPFSPQDFWEFTFDVAGEWEVVNNLDKNWSALVRVE